MKASEKVATKAIAIGVVCGASAYYFVPGFHWGVYIGLGSFIAAASYNALLQMEANEKIIDKDG